MISLTERLLARIGKTPSDFRPNSNVGRVFQSGGVRPGPEFHRITNLPEREWETDSTIPQLVQDLTEYLRAPSGSQVLRKHQALALKELHDYRRIFCDMPVGTGKTLVSFLAPVLLESKRPLLLLPAKLIGKTWREFKQLRQHWVGYPYKEEQILSYEKLSLEKWASFLSIYQPDLIICDEVHRAKNPRAGRTRRLRRYMKEAPDTVFVPLTGTPYRRSLQEVGHVAEWGMKDFSPIPRNFHELTDWSRALDEKVRDGERMGLGCLDTFGRTLEEARVGYAAKRQATPGWVHVTTSDVECSLTLQGIVHDKYEAGTDAKFKALRDSFETPDGLSFEEPIKLWAYLRQCSLGFWYRYDPPPPDEWKDARRNWASLCRDVLKHNKQNWDTPLQIATAIDQGHFADGGILRRWREIRDSYDPEKHRHTEWFDHSVLDLCADWLSKEQGIVFTPFVAFGEKLKEVTGLPYFAAQGKDKQAGLIDAYEGGPCIASVMSNLEGRNLQDRWNKALLVGGETNSSVLEQLVGRLHRSGQLADEVEFNFLLGVYENWEAVENARREALAKIGDAPNAKLVIGDWLVPTEEEVSSFGGPRWTKV